MDETLNCLRYANRAKNIQNYAVVNMDATSQMVSILKEKIQRLATDLIKARTGKVEECSYPLSVVEAIASGLDTYDDENSRTINTKTTAFATPRKSNSSFVYSSTVSSDVSNLDAETQKVRNVNETYRLQIVSLSDGEDPLYTIQYIKKATEYEREISRLKRLIEEANKCDILSLLTLGEVPRNKTISDKLNARSESPELSRLKSQIFGSLSKSSTLDAEIDAEEKAVDILSSKYINSSDTEFSDDNCNSVNSLPCSSQSVCASASLDASLFVLSNSISAKEALIDQLQASQEKFDSMRTFYEDKLREMENTLLEKEAEARKLSNEIQKLDVGNTKSKELSEKLKQKQLQLDKLRKKQAELHRLTNVASRNENKIQKLRNEVKEMKQKKVDLQKQMTLERKNHMVQVKKFKKESIQKDQQLNKVKREVSKKSRQL
jgi:hypothetical protein